MLPGLPTLDQKLPASIEDRHMHHQMVVPGRKFLSPRMRPARPIPIFVIYIPQFLFL